MRTKTPLFLSVLVVAALAATGYFLHRDNVRLGAQAATLRQRNASVTRLVAENQRTRELLAREKTDANDAAQAIHQDVVQLRAEVGELEARARAASAKKATAIAALAVSRDPEQALTPLENFQNVGRGTPGAAVQTLIWAVLKADEPALVASLALADDAREKAQQLLAHLPESARTKYPAPENLAALVLTDAILRADALQIVDTTPVDARHAIVNVRFADADGTEKVPTELGADGWKVTVPKKLMISLEKKLSPPAPPPVAPKTNG